MVLWSFKGRPKNVLDDSSSLEKSREPSSHLIYFDSKVSFLERLSSLSQKSAEKITFEGQRQNLSVFLGKSGFDITSELNSIRKLNPNQSVIALTLGIMDKACAADLNAMDGVEAFWCFPTQTLQEASLSEKRQLIADGTKGIPDKSASLILSDFQEGNLALSELMRILRPGGIALIRASGDTQIFVNSQEAQSLPDAGDKIDVKDGFIVIRKKPEKDRFTKSKWR
jgi:hypothetical protein